MFVIFGAVCIFFGALHIDPAYPHSVVLGFVPPSNVSRFWGVPAQPECRPIFIASLLDLLGDWSFCFAWRHLGYWPAAADIEKLRVNDVVEHRLLSAIGMPMGSDHVVEFRREEGDNLVALMFLTTIFGWSVGEDLYVVPDHARTIVKVSHHNVVEADFRDARAMEGWVSEMEKRGYPLPSEPPDATFKRPDWM
jgi:hypothetical protein